MTAAPGCLATPRSRAGHHYYICGSASRAGKEACAARPIQRELIERKVLQRLLHVILQESHLERIVELTNEELRKAAEAATGEGKTIGRRLASVRARLWKLYEAIETGALSVADLAPRIKDLRGQEKVLAAQLHQAAGRSGGHEIRVVKMEEILDVQIQVSGRLSGGPGRDRTCDQSVMSRPL